MLPWKSYSVPSLGLTLQHFTHSDSAPQEPATERIQTAGKSFHDKVPLILRHSLDITEPAVVKKSHQTDEVVTKGTNWSLHDLIPIILRSSSSNAIDDGGPVVAVDPNKEDRVGLVKEVQQAVAEDPESDDRGGAGRIVNTKGQKRNPVYPGEKSRKSIKLSKPLTIATQNKYKPEHYPNYPRFQQKSQVPYAYSPPSHNKDFKPEVDRPSRVLSAHLEDKIREIREEEFKEISVAASISTDDSCGGWWVSWLLCKAGL